ncbi:MAG: DUF2232 domain-containing protein [Bdellovibrionales bacterium]|nr:DUF2232 domain-containing protein [Bdellovibrionales bacterium]MBT3526865.1 DUF2232 domain-containing protein [Bdellovibrionales bacterium]MBT7669543.1 DUF2232 domain-containing protein [Bdellovibrionales bacterium]
MIMTMNHPSYKGKTPVIFWRALFLGLLTMALCSFVPFSIFAPVPLAMAALLFGRMVALTVGGISFVILLVMFNYLGLSMLVAGLFVLSAIYAAMITQVVLKGIPPVKGIVSSGAIIIVAMAALIGVSLLASDLSLREELMELVSAIITQFKQENQEMLSRGGDEVRNLLAMLNHPDQIVDEMLRWLPSAIFGTAYMVLWASFFMLLKNSAVWKRITPYQYSVRDLVSFRMPDFMIWPLIAALTLILAGEYLFGAVGVTIGGNLLYCLGLFFFFQGIGIYVDSLRYMGVYGVFRSILTAFTIVFAWKVLALMGVFDMWFNFRKWLVKKNSDSSSQD